MAEDLKTPEGVNPEGLKIADLEKELESVRNKLNETTKESITRKEKIREQENKVKEYETLITNFKSEQAKTDSNQLSDTIRFQLELKEKQLRDKELELEKIKNENTLTKSEIEQKEKAYQQLETKLKEIKEQETKKRDSLLKEIKTIAEAKNNTSLLEIAEAINDNDKLDKYYKQITERNEILVDKRKHNVVVGGLTNEKITLSKLSELRSTDINAYNIALEQYKKQN